MQGSVYACVYMQICKQLYVCVCLKIPLAHSKALAKNLIM